MDATVTVHTDTREFAELARPFYAADPVRHTAALTALRSVETAGKAGALATVTAADRVVGAFVWDPPFPATVSGVPATAARQTAEAVASAGATLRSVRGPRLEVESFAEAWCSVTDVTAEESSSQWLYELGDVLTLPQRVDGQFRPATVDDAERIAEWRQAFAQEAGMRLRRPETSAAVAELIAEGTTCGLWWVAGEPVAMATAREPECGMSRISYVYTPPELRGRGYASAVTAAVSQLVRAGGVRHIVLFADRANPISNRIYQRMGFEKKEEHPEFVFTTTAAP
ncbi:GNAT family N-acetyltransferase [Prauserella endophytica]|uniref:GNAT family N-acetyltransferase n=1 Tax=Prauserella endophytica TaxID=1592324 RepID=A0ABY2RUA2_9PSEU|nr:GNAT family N-acetyltransferase [Prauserella endophytica]TKG59874.1 GNAT family N-acetyltransferase [Prauserella endophytica]